MQMYHVHYQEVAPGGDLHFNANADLGAVYNFALGPVDIACNFLRPSPEPLELQVKQLSYGSATVRVNLLLDEQLKTRQSGLISSTSGARPSRAIRSLAPS
jgi:hypothetical protein